jgi:hypothetical protein
MVRLVTITISMLLAGALAANAQTWRGAQILHKQAENFTPIEKAACGPFFGAHCGPFHHWVCGPRGFHCWCARC